MKQAQASFNPIKVLFLLAVGIITVVSSYGLSILSRFYFYYGKWIELFLDPVLSILSRFYFYLKLSPPVFVTRDCFQSYQGSIFTIKQANVITIHDILSILSRFYFYCRGEFLQRQPVCRAFNPIKVLFLLENEKEKKNASDLSILSRFYFYTMSFTSSSMPIIYFQSYQGSIFTVQIVWELRNSRNFQSYQGSIFTIIILTKNTFNNTTDNTIKII